MIWLWLNPLWYAPKILLRRYNRRIIGGTVKATMLQSKGISKTIEKKYVNACKITKHTL